MGRIGDRANDDQASQIRIETSRGRGQRSRTRAHLRPDSGGGAGFRLGRAERERIFWERVASGRPSAAGRRRRPSRARASEMSGRGESLEAAVLTLLTVVLFGLGWVAVEIERPWDGTRAADGYAWAAMQPAQETTRPSMRLPARPAARPAETAAPRTPGMDR